MQALVREEGDPEIHTHTPQTLEWILPPTLALQGSLCEGFTAQWAKTNSPPWPSESMTHLRTADGRREKKGLGSKAETNEVGGERTAGFPRKITVCLDSVCSVPENEAPIDTNLIELDTK